MVIPPQRPRAGIWTVIIVGVVAVALAGFVGVRGLFANPVVSVDRSGVTTLSGSFEPVTCATRCVQGYIQSGARSVFVQFNAGCGEPQRDTGVTVRAIRAPDLGSGAYRVLGCGS